MDNHVKKHGWTAVPRDVNVFLSETLSGKALRPLLIDDLPFPIDELVTKVQAYAKSELREETYNHSMRVYYFARAIIDNYLPQLGLDATTLALTCLLHDIGTTHSNLRATRMSFEFYGGFLALNLLQGKDYGAPKSMAESVAEAIIRHQDLGETGKITVLGQIIQLATVYDNMGNHREIIHKVTLEDVVERFPRKGWSGCFASTIREENKLKPWAHTTALGEEDFPYGVANNRLMAPYDE